MAGQYSSQKLAKEQEFNATYMCVCLFIILWYCKVFLFHCRKSKPSSSVNGEMGATTKQHHSKSTTPRTHSDHGNMPHQQPEHVTETPKWSPNQNSKTTSVILPHLHDLKMRDKVAGPSNSDCPSPEVGMQNRVRSLCRRDGSIAEDRVLEDSDESRTHFRVLMSWESDYLRGSKATRGPILYVMDKMPEQLEAIKGQFLLSMWCIIVTQ